MPYKKQIRELINRGIKKPWHLRFPHNKGFCNICEKDVVFYEEGTWLRDQYKCSSCHTIPRNRALVKALTVFYPNWKENVLHESSPGGPLSAFLKKSNKSYTASHYYDDVPRGEFKGEFRSEDISALTFADESLDLFISSDVFEHVIEPEMAFNEIARVLKPGGAHVFSMPWYPENAASIPRARLKDGKIINLEEPVYHGNPISEDGSLVTTDWGRDFCDIIFRSSRLYTVIYLEKNRQLGIDGEFLEIFISMKLPSEL